MNSHAVRIHEHPWESRTLPRRPTRLVAVPPANPGSRAALRPVTAWGRLIRTLRRAWRWAAPALESLAFVALLAGLLGGMFLLDRL